MIPSTMKNVEDIRAATAFAVIDEVFSCREAHYSGSDGAYRLTRVGMLSEEPETIGDAVNYAVRNLQCHAARPVEEYLVEITLCIR